MRLFGVNREVKAVDDVSLHIGRDEIYGLAGESSSGKSSLIKTIARAIRPPLNVVSGSVTFNFKDGLRDIYRLSPEELSAIRWSHLSYIMQSSMSVLNPVRRIKHSFDDFALPHVREKGADFTHLVERHLERLHLAPDVLQAYPHELSGGMRQTGDDCLGDRLRPGIHHRGRAHDRPRCDRAEGRARDAARHPAGTRFVSPLRDARHGRSRQPDRSTRHHVCRPTGGGWEDEGRLRAPAPSLHRSSDREPAATWG